MKVLPPDVAAYLLAAARELMTESGFTPASRDDAEKWLHDHCKEVGELARTKMQALADKLFGKPELMAVVTDKLSEQVYYRLRTEKTAAQWNPRYVAYAKENGCDPDEMLARDGGKMTNFLCWHPK